MARRHGNCLQLQHLFCILSLHLLIISSVPGNAQEASLQKFTCETSYKDFCYWSYVQENSTVEFATAEDICLGQGAYPAIIPNQNTYNKILKKARRKIPPNSTWTTVWTGMRYYPETKEKAPEDAFWHWFPIVSEDPAMRIPWSYDRSANEYTYIYIELKRLHRSQYQGMINREPSMTRSGVVCEKRRLNKRLSRFKRRHAKRINA